MNVFRSCCAIRPTIIFLLVWSLAMVACQPTEPEMVVVTEVVQLGDEQNLNDPTIRANTAARFANIRDDFPDTILYCNSYGGQLTNENLGLFIQTSQPDMLSFDTYVLRTDVPLVGGSLRPLYGDMQRYRKWALGFGLPYAMYSQTYHSTGDYRRDPSVGKLHDDHSTDEGHARTGGHSRLGGPKNL